MNESRVVLDALEAQLRATYPNESSPLRVTDDRLEMLEGNLSVHVKITNDPGYHSSIAHCHLIAKLGNDTSDHLDACVLGINQDREVALRDAAKTWVSLVAPAVLSVAKANSVANSQHFHGTEHNSVVGCHGFMGPLSHRMTPDDFDIDGIGDCELFEYASAMAPPGIVHLAKVTLEATPEGVWNRTIEVDGHEASFRDQGHPSWPKSPAMGLVTRYAVFHHGNATESEVMQRGRIDAAIEAFVVAVGEFGNIDEAHAQLCSQGFEESLVDQVTNFCPSAATQVVFAGLVRSFATTYVRVTKEGECLSDMPLMKEPAFARTMMLFPKWIQQPAMLEPCKKTAMVSSEFNSINEALHRGSDAKNLCCSPVIIPDRDASAEQVERAMETMMERLRVEHHGQANTKPWWRFW
ncbi:MAG: hypothetical protein WBD31_23405 [Rubripirellula sp.]